MGESQVVGEASGMKILGLITIGASRTADGVDAGNRGDSTLGITSTSAGSFAGGALAPIMALTSSTSMMILTLPTRFRERLLQLLPQRGKLAT